MQNLAGAVRPQGCCLEAAPLRPLEGVPLSPAAALG